MPRKKQAVHASGLVEVKATVGKAIINAIKPIDVQKFYDTENISLLSSALKVKLKNILNGLFESAVDNEICIRNPSKNIVLPAYKKVIEKHTYTLYEQRLIIDYIKSSDVHKDIVILLKTGLRRGELLALEWADIDLTNKVICVNKSLKDTSDVPTVGAPKIKSL